MKHWKDEEEFNDLISGFWTGVVLLVLGILWFYWPEIEAVYALTMRHG